MSIKDAADNAAQEPQRQQEQAAVYTRSHRGQKKKKSSNTPIWVVALVLVAALAGVTGFLLGKNKAETVTKEVTVTKVVKDEKPIDITAQVVKPLKKSEKEELEGKVEFHRRQVSEIELKHTELYKKQLALQLENDELRKKLSACEGKEVAVIPMAPVPEAPVVMPPPAAKLPELPLTAPKGEVRWMAREITVPNQGGGVLDHNGNRLLLASKDGQTVWRFDRGVETQFVPITDKKVVRWYLAPAGVKVNADGSLSVPTGVEIKPNTSFTFAVSPQYSDMKKGLVEGKKPYETNGQFVPDRLSTAPGGKHDYQLTFCDVFQYVPGRGYGPLGETELRTK